MSDLEARIRRLEDIETIKQLKARYCAACDDGYDPDRLASLFTEDALWDGGNTFGVAQGRDAIHRHFAGASARVTIARHQVMNPIIDMEGDSATGHLLLFQPCTNANRYGRIEGEWLISATVIEVAFFTPFDRGWVDQRFLPGREP